MRFFNIIFFLLPIYININLTNADDLNPDAEVAMFPFRYRRCAINYNPEPVPQC